MHGEGICSRIFHLALPENRILLRSRGFRHFDFLPPAEFARCFGPSPPPLPVCRLAMHAGVPGVNSGFHSPPRGRLWARFLAAFVQC